MSSVIAAYPGVATAEVSSQLVLAFHRGFGTFSVMGEKILAQEGLFPIDPNRWYPLARFLAAFDAIRARIGPKTLYQIGLKVPETAMFPPGVNSAQTVLAGCPLGFQMNHRNGDLGTVQHTATGERSALLRSENPYPCPFEEGVITAMAKLFEPRVRVMHEDGCRENGSRHCSYNVTW